MSERVQHLSLAEQIGAVDRARRIVAGAARVPSRAVERDYDVQALEAAHRTLRWLRAHEAEVRAAVLPKRPSDAQAPVDARAPERDAAPRKENSTPCEFPLARRAAMRCAEGTFQKFLGVETAEAAVDELRRRCNIASRKEFDRDAAARERWRAVDAEFSAWLCCADGDGDERG